MNSSALAESAATNWRRTLAAAIRDPDRLCDLLELPETFRRGAGSPPRKFGLLAPMPFVNRIRKGDPDDPLLATDSACDRGRGRTRWLHRRSAA